MDIHQPFNMGLYFDRIYKFKEGLEGVSGWYLRVDFVVFKDDVSVQEAEDFSLLHDLLSINVFSKDKSPLYRRVYPISGRYEVWAKDLREVTDKKSLTIARLRLSS